MALKKQPSIASEHERKEHARSFQNFMDDYGYKDMEMIKLDLIAQKQQLLQEETQRFEKVEAQKKLEYEEIQKKAK